MRALPELPALPPHPTCPVCWPDRQLSDEEAELHRMWHTLWGAAAGAQASFDRTNSYADQQRRNRTADALSVFEARHPDLTRPDGV